jgi:sugar phosphate permease
MSLRARVFAITWLAYASYYLCRKNFSVSKTALEDQMGMTKRVMGMVDTGYLLAYAVGQFVMGVLGDRLGPRRLVGVGMILSALLVAVAGSLTAAVGIAVAFTLNGFVQASGWPGTVKAMTPWFGSEERGRVMGLWSTCYQVGGLASGALAAWLVKQAGWRSAFFVPAAWVALVGGLVLLALPEADEGPAAARSDAQKRLVQSPAVWALGASYFCLKLIRYSLLFWLPYYLERSLGYERLNAGYQSLSFEIGGVLGAVGVGFLSDRVFSGRRGMAGLLGCLGLAASFFIYATVARMGVAANFAAMALVGICLFGPDALISAAAAQDLGGKEASAAAAGFINGLGSVGAVLQGVVTAEVSERYGWDALFQVFVWLSVMAALLLVPRVLEERRLAAPTGSGAAPN